MGKQLTIGQTAKRLGLEVDTVRKLERAGKLRAIRTRGGHRRFTEEEIDRFRRGRRKIARAKSRPVRRIETRQQPGRTVQSRNPRTGEFLPVGVEMDFDDFDEDLPLDEFDDEIELGTLAHPQAAQFPPRRVGIAPASVRLPLSEPRSVAPMQPPAREMSFADPSRLQTIKGYGRLAIPWNTPPEWQGRVIADLERYVTATQFPADLSFVQAAEIVRAHVAEVLRPHHEAEAIAARQKKNREEADRRRALLIAKGNNYAWRETIGWDWSSTSDARDEVKKVLEREVEHDWTEREVENAVDEVLEEWDDEDEESDEG